MPYYVPHMQDILDEIGIPPVRAFRVRVDEYVQEILGTKDLDADEVWRILYPKLQDPAYKKQFTEQLRAKWEARDARNEGLG
ncbi:hypothetical protein FBQ82_07120 [Anaerolineae bacterium CFX7]|nr:hypothetical protein [Anaerolineae bacterium CFX7]RIK25119.1 MAG: hypothetical protein DCC52_11655 [Chloroflexota bacterium]